MTTGVMIKIAGVPIATSWDGTDLIGVDNLTIQWGRSELYEQPDPSILTLTLIDRAGTFVTDDTRVGQEITVAIADPYRVVFRGALSAPTAERREVWNSDIGDYETVWVTQVTASDTLAALAMSVFRGTAIDGWYEGAGGWTEVSPSRRISDLLAAGASQLVTAVASVDTPVVSPSVAILLHGQTAAEAKTALDLIRQCYQVVPLSATSYDADTDTVYPASFLPQTVLALGRAGGKIVVTSTGGLVVPADSVGVESYRLTSTLADSIDAVQLAYVWYGKDPALSAGAQKRTIYTGGMIEAATRRDTINPRTRRVLKIDSQVMIFDTGEFLPGQRDPNNRFPAYLLGQLTAIVNAINGQVRLPALTFDAHRLPLPADIEAVIYQTRPSTRPIYFAGSVFNGLRGSGPQFQIIGGTLRYSKTTWSHTVTLAPALAAASASPLTLGQLVTDKTATLGDFHPAVHLADLGIVTKGLT